MQRGCSGLVLLALVLFPAFSFLDYYTHTNDYHQLWRVRFLTTFIYLISYFLLKQKMFQTRPFAVALFLVGSAGISIAVMCFILGGFRSPYYAGINLVVLAAVLLLPLGPRKMSLVVAFLIGIYLIGCLFAAGTHSDDLKYLVNNMYFLLSTGIIGITAAGLTQKMRMESFHQVLQVEKAKQDIKRSRDLLQVELQSEQGNVEVLIKEITERKSELENALRYAEAAKTETQQALELREEFISLASHELNTPLTSLKMQTQMAQRKLHGPQGLETEVVEKMINTYDAQLQRLIRIVGDMLDISRIKSGKLELEKSQTDVSELVREVIERTSHKFQDHDVVINTDLQGPLVVSVDHFRFEQVVLNLFTNALKYGVGRPVSVKVYRRNDRAVVEVEDQGIGIPQESLQRIFKRFERAVRSKEFSGLGLGLYISQKIIEAHGGAIAVESTQGRGSTFRVEVPV